MFKITAYKKCKDRETSCITPCEKDDHDAIKFKVHYPGCRAALGEELEFDELFKAHLAISALSRAHLQGKLDNAIEIRKLLGI